MVGEEVSTLDPGGHAAAVRVQSLSKRYESGGVAIAALEDLHLSIEAGAIIAITGPSGSGKSTLLHLLGAMDVADAGTIHVGEIEVTALTRAGQVDYRRRIGFVFQRFHLLPALTAVDNVAVPLLPYRTRFDKHVRANELLRAVGLGGREDSLPAELSGGEQQRVAIARALINEPVLLLADEPTGNLDSHTGAEIVELLLELRAQRGMTMVLATHDPIVASRCEQIVRILDGHVVDVLDVPTPPELGAVLERISRIEP